MEGKTWEANSIFPEAEGEKGLGAADGNSLVVLTASGHFNLKALGPDGAADSSPPPPRYLALPPYPHTNGHTGRPSLEG